MRFFSTLVATALGSLVAFVLLCVVGFMILAGLAASVTSTGPPPVRSESILVLNLSGPITELTVEDPFLELFGDLPAHSLQSITGALERAATDDRIEAVWLRPNGVAAGWSTMGEIHQALLDFKTSGKPVIASSNATVFFETDYFLASAADEIYGNPEAMIEFNGLYMGLLFYKGLLDKLGVDVTVLRSGAFKSAAEPFLQETMSAENREQLNAILTTWNRLYTHSVAESRSMTAEEVQSLAESGTIITTEDAVDAGILDGVMFADAVEDRIAEVAELSDRRRTIRVSNYGRPAPVRADDAMAIVYAAGTIVPGTSGAAQSTVGSTTFRRAMERADENEDVKAIVLRIDSPGGSAMASEAMWQVVKDVADRKPVVVSMGDLAASGGYWLATAADTIVASPETLTGSIGVFMMHVNLAALLESKLGITSDGVGTSRHADMLSGMRPLTESERQLLTRTVDETYDKFLAKVSDSRGLTVSEVHELAQGRVWTGSDAFDLGLVDQLGGLDEAIALAEELGGLTEGAYRTLMMPQPKTFMEELTDAFTLRLRTWLESPLETELRERAELLEHLLELERQPLALLPWEITGQ